MEEKSGICMLKVNVFEQGDLGVKNVERHPQYCLMELIPINDLAIKIIRKWWTSDAVVVLVIDDYPEEEKSNTVAMLQCGDKCKKSDNKPSMLSLTWKSAFLVTMFRMTRFSDAIDLFFITTKSDFQYMF